jgi:hypothetical protein
LLGERADQAVSDQLQRGGVASQVGADESDDSSGIASVHGAAQLSSPLRRRHAA